MQTFKFLLTSRVLGTLIHKDERISIFPSLSLFVADTVKFRDFSKPISVNINIDTEPRPGFSKAKLMEDFIDYHYELEGGRTVRICADKAKQLDLPPILYFQVSPE